MRILTKTENIVYQTFLKPMMFACDPEFIHTLMSGVGERIEKQDRLLGLFFGFKNEKLKKTILGIAFDNPIGLAAGFDYDGHMACVMKHVGFGFNTIGTVTAKCYEGNPKPRMLRLPKSKAILVNKGFKSEGAIEVARRLDKKDLGNHTIGISVGSSNVPEVDTIPKAIEDYLFTFDVFRNKNYVTYFELNISCPNTTITGTFTTPKNFEILVRDVKKLKINQPIFVKMPNEIDSSLSDELVSIAIKHGIRGFIFSNLVKDRNNTALNKEEIKKLATYKGNFSGKPTAENANNLIKHTRKKFGDSVAIIGCGGIFSYEDAQIKFNNGADLVQLITGMIYQGPQLIGEICEKLARSR